MKTFCRRVLVRLLLLGLAIVLTGAVATAKPTVSIANLKAGQSFTNAAFTVSGAAASSAGISNVLFSLNQGAWSGTTSSNQWTNWTAAVTWIPGTNTFSVAAVDNSGSFSATNNVKVFYSVTTALTVVINGDGSVSPNYNGQPLVIGKGYSMKAAAGKGTQKGYGFRNWTDGNNNVLTTAATVKFLMASNLTFAANFGYTGKPTISVTSTTTNSDGYPADFVIHGTTSGTVAVTNVYYQLNGSLWTNASSSNHWANWTANVRLAPGGNTFNAYALNASNNPSTTFVVQLVYSSAPASLAGQFAVVTDVSNTPLFTVALGKSTFSQVSPDTNNLSGVGTYTYTPNGGAGTLRFRYTAPPSVVNKAENFGMAFFTPSLALVGITNSTRTNSAYMQFSAASNFAPASVSGQLVWSIGSQGGGSGTLYQKTTYTATDLISGETNSGSYTYTQYSPVGSLFKLTGTNGTAYILANFEATNYGAYSESDYTAAGLTNGTDTGRFFFDTQVAGGDAPLTVSNQNLQITSVDGSFNVQFGADTYGQASLNTNFDNAVGSYTYARTATNIGQLNLTATAPPDQAGTNSAARLIFVSPNTGLFTNGDGTLSSFVLTTATNYAPASLTNLSFPIGFYANIQFTNDGSFVYTVYNNPFFPNTYSGNYTYTNFSPGTAMVQLSYLYSNTVVGTDWLQLNFTATNSGNVFWSQYDTNGNYIDIYFRGAFHAY
jgi:hypothetical protein